MGGHMLVISLNQDMVRVAQKDGETVDPTDPEFWDTIEVRCLEDPGDSHRVCVTWWECGCQPTTGQWYQIDRDGEVPCPTSPTRKHACVPHGRFVGYPSAECIGRAADNAHDAARDLADEYRLGPGEHPVSLQLGLVDGEEAVEFELLDSGRDERDH